LYNKKYCKTRFVIENTFGILKQSFHELLVKIDLYVTFVLNIASCCAILHNIIMDQTDLDVAYFLEVLESERQDDIRKGRVPPMATIQYKRQRTWIGTRLQARRNVEIYLGSQPK
jgi:hypothetical protein